MIVRGGGVVAAVALSCLATMAPAEPGYEAPPVLEAADLLGAEQLEGPSHRVDPEVPTDGFLATFTIRSPHGVFVVRGRPLAEVRIGEIRALDELAAKVPAEVFVEGLKGAAVETGQAIGRAIDDPVETAKGIPAGIGRLFTRTVRVGITGVQQINDRVAEKRAEGGSFGAEEAGIVAGRSAELAADALGRSDERRKLAKELRVDPYTTNEILDGQLDRVANAAFAGSLGVNLATSMVPGGKVVRGTSLVSDWVWDTPASELYVRIERELQAMGAPPEPIDGLLRHRDYSLTMRVALSAALTALSGVEGRPEVLRFALDVDSEDQARFVVGSVVLLARHHRESGPLSRIGAPGPVVGRAQDGELLVFAPLDHLSWSRRLESRLEAPELAAPRRSLRITGSASPRARLEIGQRGWTLLEGIPDPVSPVDRVDPGPEAGR